MSTRLNRTALDHAKELIEKNQYAKDDRDDWSEHAPSTGDENSWLEKHGWDEFDQWHLGVDEEETPETKQRYTFPFGDYRRVHRCAVISMESRAGQYDHDEIRDAARELLELIDSRG